jgi:hypothetical protein
VIVPLVTDVLAKNSNPYVASLPGSRKVVAANDTCGIRISVRRKRDMGIFSC